MTLQPDQTEALAQDLFALCLEQSPCEGATWDNALPGARDDLRKVAVRAITFIASYRPDGVGGEDAAIQLLRRVMASVDGLTHHRDTVGLDVRAHPLFDDVREFLARLPALPVEGGAVHSALPPIALHEADSTAWLIEETWSGYVHYIHRDFDAEKWRKERDLVRAMHRRQQHFITKDIAEALTFDTKDRAHAWLAEQPHWMSRGDQYQVREHMWTADAATPQQASMGGSEHLKPTQVTEDDLAWLERLKRAVDLPFHASLGGDIPPCIVGQDDLRKALSALTTKGTGR